MPLIPPKRTSNWELPPAGTYPARCIEVIDLGTQPTRKEPSRKVRIGWVLLDADTRMKDGRPFLITSHFNLYMSKKAFLRVSVESWRGKPLTDEEAETFDLETLLGKPCILGVVHTQDGDKVWANVSSISPPMKGMKVPEADLGPTFFSLDDFDQETYLSLSPYLREKIAKSPEFARIQAAVLRTDTRDGYGEVEDGEEAPF